MKILLILTVLLQISTYNPEYQFKSTSIYNQKDNNNIQTESPIYNKEYSNNKSGPRKVSGLDGWLFWLAWGNGAGVPSNASNEELFGYYNYVQNGGTLSYNDWWNQTYNPLSIGDGIIMLCLCVLFYLFMKHITYKQYNNKKIQTK